MALLIGFLFGVVLHKMPALDRYLLPKTPVIPNHQRDRSSSEYGRDRTDAVQGAELKTFLEKSLSVTEVDLDAVLLRRTHDEGHRTDA